MTSRFRVRWARVERLLERIAKRKALLKSYEDYWLKLKPTTPELYNDLWLFSTMSYLNTWQNNVRTYQYIKALGYPLHRLGKRRLLNHIKASGCGIHARRFQSIWAADSLIFRNPALIYPAPGEPLTEFRTRLRANVPGLGMAKTSFVIEMLDPTSCEVVCLDRHGLRLYGLKAGGSVDEALYTKLEAHWCNTCRALKIPAPLARHAHWDALRGEQDTRYWSYVFEDLDRAAAGHYDVHRPRYHTPI